MSRLQLNRIAYTRANGGSSLDFNEGVNVICGASDTGKSFLAESIDFMLGGKVLRDIPELSQYSSIQLGIEIPETESKLQLERSTQGGGFVLSDLSGENSEKITLKEKHVHEKTDNLSGYLLDKIDLLGKKILRSKNKGTTVSLSFRNLARLLIVQETEIQQNGSPFWTGQYTTKTSDVAVVKMLLTGVDDSSVVELGQDKAEAGNKIEVIEELISDIQAEITESGLNKNELEEQIGQLNDQVSEHKEKLNHVQAGLDKLLSTRRELTQKRTELQTRRDEISELLAKFSLLYGHYKVDIERLKAIEESGSLFLHEASNPCPLCGAPPEQQKHDADCEGNVEEVVSAASAEIQKITQLRAELQHTVGELNAEDKALSKELESIIADYLTVEASIVESAGPSVSENRNAFAELIEERSDIQRDLDLFKRILSLESQKRNLLEGNEVVDSTGDSIKTGLPNSIAHEISLKISELLKSWDFPGTCSVHYDTEATDFVIDGKARGSRGKGLRAITHAAVTLSLLEYCQLHDLPHPGFVILDSPLLAYYEPEGDDDKELQGTRLKESFYKYLTTHHSSESQVIIIENQHPPSNLEDDLKLTVFTGNPSEGRQGLL